MSMNNEALAQQRTLLQCTVPKTVSKTSLSVETHGHYILLTPGQASYSSPTRTHPATVAECSVLMYHAMLLTEKMFCFISKLFSASSPIGGRVH